MDGDDEASLDLERFAGNVGKNFVLALQSVLTYKQLRLGPEVSNCLFWNTGEE